MPPTCMICGGLHHARGYCKRHYSHRHQHGEFDIELEHPRKIVGRITLASRGITASAIAARCADAALDLAESAEDALIRGDDWRMRHPEKFTPAAIAALYPDPAGLASSAWTEDAARVAA